MIKKSNRPTIRESLGADIGKYQKWVDYDMKRYGKISDETNDYLKRAGLEVVKDQYGDYEVIASEVYNKDKVAEETVAKDACRKITKDTIKESIRKKDENKQVSEKTKQRLEEVKERLEAAKRRKEIKERLENIKRRKEIKERLENAKRRKQIQERIKALKNK